MKRYNPTEIEPKWQQIWRDDQRYKAPDASDKPKYYVTGMFPYPSGAGMHVGHFMEHSIVDAVARFRRANGHNVVYPMGWDAFGLPAENYAIKTGQSPQVTTETNIASFKNQLNRVGASIDWSRELNTSNPEYYKWTQWVFTQLFERGLAYQKEANQWWCPVDKTVLANEQVEAGKCWRCGTEVEKKSMKQWFFKITDYADALLDEIPALDWPEKIKTAQTNWIGRSQGAEIDFVVAKAVESSKQQVVSIDDRHTGLDPVSSLEAKDSLKFTPELTQLILDGQKTSTVQLEPKDLKVGDIAEFFTRDDSDVTPFGHAKITNIRTMKLVDIPNDLEGHEPMESNEAKLLKYSEYYGDDITLETEFTIYDFSFIRHSSFVTPENTIRVFTTRPDTIFGATFLVIAPEHPLVGSLANDDTRAAVEHYVADALKESEIERMSEGKEKTGVFTGSYATNPANGEQIPVWIADYVLGGYGTGAIMAVPAHDERDNEFAEKFKLPIVQVVAEHYLNEGSFAPRDELETLDKTFVDAIITDGNGNYLLMTEDAENTHFVGGGVDDTDKTAEDALRREIREETGYVDIESIKPAAPHRSFHAYRHTKDKNIKGLTSYFEVRIDANANRVKNEADTGRHSIQWVPKAKVQDLLTWESHRVSWQYYLRNKTVDSGVREGVLVNSGAFDGTSTSDAREQVVAWLEQQGVGRSKVTYKMRDWLVSRQRYWGAPIPIVHCEVDGAVAVPVDQLPVLLPEVEDYEPKGQSVLASQTDWVQTTCPTCGGPATRETDTMDGYACSSWYLLRYTDPHNAEQAWAPEKANYWTPLDMYCGGDHAVAHLLYVRFWNHVFHDMKLVTSREPVKKLVYHGYINAEDGTKMSKSKGNVVDPLEVIDQGYGADALRTFELFLGPIDENSSWSSKGIAGVYRFLNRAWTLTQEYLEYRHSGLDPESSDNMSGSQVGAQDNAALIALQHKTIKKVTTDIHRLSFNTAIAALMEYVNDLYKLKTDGYSAAWCEPIEALVQLVAPFAPHMAAELWQQLGHDDQLDFVDWPDWDDALTVTETMTIVVQVNGKLRAKLDVPKDAREDDIKSQALSDENVAKHLPGEPKKVIYVTGKLVSIVV